MKIIVASAQFPPTKSGYARVAGNLAEQFKSRGHTVLPLTEGSGCTRFGRVPVLNAQGRAIMRGGADIVQVIGPSPIFTEEVVWYARRLSIPIVYYINAFAGLATYYRGAVPALVDQIYSRTAYRVTLRQIRAAIFNTQDFAKHFPMYHVPWQVIPSGTSDPCLARACPDRVTSPRLGDALRILYAGQLRRAKGVETLLSATRRLTLSGRPVHLTIVGGGPLRSKLEQLVRDLDLREIAEFRGAVDDDQLHQEYLENDVLVMPSLLGDSFGIVLVEGGIHGIQIVASDLPGVREVVREFSGHLVPPGDVDALAATLRAIPTTPRGTRTFNPTLAHKFSWERIADEYLTVYHQLLDPSNSFPGATPTD